MGNTNSIIGVKIKKAKSYYNLVAETLRSNLIKIAKTFYIS